MRFRRSKDPRDQEFHRRLQTVFSPVHPAVQEPISIGLQLRVLNAAVALEGVPQIGAAIAHELHCRFVFLVPFDEFVPIVGQTVLLDHLVVRRRAVVRRLRAFGNPAAEAFRYHVPGRNPELFVEDVAESGPVVEGHLHVGVPGYLSRVRRPYPFLESSGPCGGETHLVKPKMLRQLRLFRPSGRRVEASIRPKLRGLDVDARDPRDDPIGAVHHDQGDYVLDFGDRELRGRKRRAARVAALRAAFRAFVGSDAVVPAPVELQASAAPGAPRIPLVLPGEIGFHHPCPFRLPALPLAQ